MCVKKFKEVLRNLKRLVTNIDSPMHHSLARSAENMVIVSESVANGLNVSIPRGSQQLELSYDTLWHILH